MQIGCFLFITFDIPAKVLVEFAFVMSALLYKLVIAQVPQLGLTLLAPGDGCVASLEDLGLDHHIPEHGAGQLQGGDGPVVQEGEHCLEQRGLHDQHQEVAGLEMSSCCSCLEVLEAFMDKNLVRVVFVFLPASVTAFEHLFDVHNVSDKFECLLSLTVHHIFLSDVLTQVSCLATNQTARVFMLINNLRPESAASRSNLRMSDFLCSPWPGLVSGLRR